MVRRIKVCLNGGRRRADHPGVPVTPAELARSAVAAVAAGAEAVHLHPRGADGAESLRQEDVAAAVRAVRLACPTTPIGVSTGLWITGRDLAARLALVAGWADLSEPGRPDFASVNVSEPGAGELATVLRGAGIGLEVGVWSATDAENLPPADWARILVEIVDVPAAGSTDATASQAVTAASQAVTAAEEVLRRLDELGVPGPRLVHGEGPACWPLVAYAGQLGLPTRIGLEDTLTGPGGEPVSGNAELIRLGLEVWQRAGVTGQAVGEGG